METRGRTQRHPQEGGGGGGGGGGQGEEEGNYFCSHSISSKRSADSESRSPSPPRLRSQCVKRTRRDEASSSSSAREFEHAVRFMRSPRAGTMDFSRGPRPRLPHLAPLEIHSRLPLVDSLDLPDFRMEISENPNMSLNANFSDSTSNDDDDDDERGEKAVVVDEDEEEAEAEAEFEEDYSDEEEHEQGHEYDDLRNWREQEGLLASVAPAPASSRARFNAILDVLCDDSDVMAQVDALNELCGILAMASRQSIVGLNANSYVPVLLHLLSREGFSELMFHAARAIVFLLDLEPRHCNIVVNKDGIAVLCARLLSIEYMDLAEQSLYALAKVSESHAESCLCNGALRAVLQYADFFASPLQQVALTISGNICKRLSHSTVHNAIDMVPTLRDFLASTDVKVVQSACNCLCKIIESCAASSENLVKLSSFGLISQTCSLISNSLHGGSDTTVSTSMYMALIKLLSACASSSALSAKELLEIGISGILRDTLTGAGISVDKSADQFYDILLLANKLLPFVPTRTASICNHNSNATGITGSLSAQQTTNSDIVNQPAHGAGHGKLLSENPQLLVQFGEDLLPVLTKLSGNSISIRVRREGMIIVRNLLWYCPVETLTSFMQTMQISSFLARVLSEDDVEVLFSGLEIVEILMQKVPTMCKKLFTKEGVFYSIVNLIPAGSSSSICTSGHRRRRNSTAISSATAISRSGISRNDTNNLERGRALERELLIVNRNYVEFYAKHIKSTYIGNEMSEDGCMAFNLKILCQSLNDALVVKKFKVKAKGRKIPSMSMDFDHLLNILSDILSELVQDDGVSTFEFTRSGIIEALLNYFQAGNTSTQIYEKISLDYYEQLIKRIQLFLKIALPESGAVDKSPLCALVRKLQDTLSLSERFELVYSFKSATTSISKALDTFNRSVRLQLLKDKEDDLLVDYPLRFIHMKLSDSVYDLENAIWNKVNKVAVAVGHSTEHFGAVASNKSFDLAGISEAYNHEEFEAELEDYPMNDSLLSRNSLVSAGRGFHETFASLNNSDNVGQTGLLQKQGSINSVQRLDFYMYGKQLEPSASIYTAILQANAEKQVHKGDRFDNASLNSSCLFDRTYAITYKRGRTSIDEKLMKDKKPTKSNRASLPLTLVNLPIVDIIAQRKLPFSLKERNVTYDTLLLLKVLEVINHFAPSLKAEALIDSSQKDVAESFNEITLQLSNPVVSQTEFLNNQLTTKLVQQMQDIVTLCTKSSPSWCEDLTKSYPFIFPFEVRRKFFFSSSLGLSYGLHNVFQQLIVENPTLVSNWEYKFRDKLKRYKVSVSRDNILKSAAAAMEECSMPNTLLEIAYIGEVGTGLGPTLEFYTLVSHEFQKVVHGMWRNLSTKNSQLDDQGTQNVEEKDNSQLNHIAEFVGSSLGLFPRPYLIADYRDKNFVKYQQVIENFTLLGHVFAKALQDGRLLDLPLAKEFYKLILGQELTIYDIYSFDTELGSTLLEMQTIVNRKKALKSVEPSNAMSSADLCYRGARIEDLYINFTLPGFDDFPLKAGGEDIFVDIDNLEEYVALTVAATLKTGIMPQIEAFKAGFSQVLSISSLQIFFAHELDSLFCGVHNAWKPEILADNIKFDHGYTVESPEIQNLLEILGSFDPSQQRAFLQFVTGCPRLPLGGLSSLTPRLTIVRKKFSVTYEDSNSVTVTELDLPSAMTCVNYLKLPPYSTKEIMRDRLLYAINEGRGSFDLS